jgi:DNA-binding response OmpR family regulator
VLNKTLAANSFLMKSTEVLVNKFCIALVTAEEELWGVEKIRLALSSAGYKVVAAKCWEAVEVIERVKPDLVIASLDGQRLEDLRLCKLLGWSNGAPLLVIGAPLESTQILAMFEAGITDYIARPINLRELVVRVRNILHRTQPPFQTDGTAELSQIVIESPQTSKISFQGLLCALVRHLARRIPHCSP